MVQKPRTWTDCVCACGQVLILLRLDPPVRHRRLESRFFLSLLHLCPNHRHRGIGTKPRQLHPPPPPCSVRGGAAFRDVQHGPVLGDDGGHGVAESGHLLCSVVDVRVGGEHVRSRAGLDFRGGRRRLFAFGNGCAPLDVDPPRHHLVFHSAHLRHTPRSGSRRVFAGFRVSVAMGIIRVLGFRVWCVVPLGV